MNNLNERRFQLAGFKDTGWEGVEKSVRLLSYYREELRSALNRGDMIDALECFGAIGVWQRASIDTIGFSL